MGISELRKETKARWWYKTGVGLYFLTILHKEQEKYAFSLEQDV